ncbi:MAG TPA: response regulator [Bryobacteraceae bacterium]|nr:response regulator [Bryobacteraceae bacterium]
MARKILLADDSVTAQNMGRKNLSDAGYDVVTVNNGSAALKRVAELKPDVVVLDIYMPGYGGLEVCQRLKDSPETERIPVLLTVGKLEPFKPDEARRVRADAYIIKPFEATELLGALARMEDRIVPEQEDADTSWKSRLRFPSKKKKEEPEPELEVAEVPKVRNSQREKNKASISTADAGTAAPELTVVPDIPRDITPEELDALSALAAKLDGPSAADLAPAVDKAAWVEARIECKPIAPASEEKSVAEVAAVGLESEGVSEAPAANPPAEASALNADEPAAVSEVNSGEIVHVESLADEPAPVDREDEPLFAVAASAVEPIAQEEQAEVKESPAAGSEATVAANLSETTTIEANEEPEEPKIEAVSPVVEVAGEQECPDVEATPTVEKTANPEAVVEAVPPVRTAEETELGPAPSDAELAEALRLLTPELGHSDPSSIPTQENLVAAGAMLAEQAARDASEAPRWVAAAVAVSPEEAALSLETEMFRTLAGVAVDDSPATAAAFAASPTAVECVEAAEAKAEIVEETAADTMAGIASVALETTALSIDTMHAERQDSPAEEEAEEPATATFADAVQRDEVEVVSATPVADPASDVTVPVEEVEPTVVEAIPTSAAAAEGEETMARERAKAGKSKWHQIRSASTADAASNDAVEAAKQAVPDVEEAPKAMAAAAAADSAAGSAVSPDANTIASIVDSVLADLRPKIVEEIAKKLARK